MSFGQILALVPEALWESIYMTIGSTALAYVIGLPLGLVLVVTARDGIHPMRALNMVLGAVVNFLRSIPFVILLFFVTPLTRLIVGRAIGSEAAIVPLVISAFPFVARMVELLTRHKRSRRIHVPRVGDDPTPSAVTTAGR